MAAVTEKFGRNPHVVMGAVIDEGLKQKVEVCVIGTSDMSTSVSKTPLPRSKSRTNPKRSDTGIKTV